ncbi:putative transmembrane protein [Rhodopirellula islandica]|uniref:Transmembrane protein n=1 Tax=Rhodopirellula islandica TaxID=595434 RepID=A0A0J1BIJ0_RHOIS|nr:twin-arginine translocase TatA/TatE family subunit [Rhodopirellula islandica]KLU06278.1 putative transmembrane protein [Rhodopirellula islandica]
MFGLSPFELAVIGVIAVVLFGGNLPEVARKFGSTYSQFRRSLQDVQQQFRQVQDEASRTMSMDTPPAKSTSYDDEEDEPNEPSAPKFTPPE